MDYNNNIEATTPTPISEDETLLLPFLSHIVTMDMVALVGLMTLLDVEVDFNGEVMVESLIEEYLDWPRERRSKLLLLLDAAYDEEE